MEAVIFCTLSAIGLNGEDCLAIEENVEEIGAVLTAEDGFENKNGEEEDAIVVKGL